VTNLGRNPALIMKTENKEQKWILKMDNGDSTFCSQARRSEVHFFLVSNTFSFSD
jgi:hypothetical protein